MKILASLVLSLTAFGRDRIGDIEFFGAKGLEMARIRDAVPVKSGDAYSDGVKGRVRKALSVVSGEPTDVAAICCDEDGDYLLFIGLGGTSSRVIQFNPPPAGRQRLPLKIVRAYARLDKAIEAAVRAGGSAAEEDVSHGYALIKDPAARKIQMEVRQWVLQHEANVREVLAHSAVISHRRIAGDALGYARQSEGQIEALVRASSDPDDEVRNNAVRALGVLVRARPSVASMIRAEAFVAMLSSGAWTDRNKAASLLAAMTFSRPAGLLAELRASNLDSLVEMASWRRFNHAYFSRMILGRMAGIPEDRLSKLAEVGPVEDIIEAVKSLSP